jgi:hypothetical protein
MSENAASAGLLDESFLVLTNFSDSQECAALGVHLLGVRTVTFEAESLRNLERPGAQSRAFGFYCVSQIPFTLVS